MGVSKSDMELMLEAKKRLVEYLNTDNRRHARREGKKEKAK